MRGNPQAWAVALPRLRPSEARHPGSFETDAPRRNLFERHGLGRLTPAESLAPVVGGTRLASVHEVVAADLRVGRPISKRDLWSTARLAGTLEAAGDLPKNGHSWWCDQDQRYPFLSPALSATLTSPNARAIFLRAFLAMAFSRNHPPR